MQPASPSLGADARTLGDMAPRGAQLRCARDHPPGAVESHVHAVRIRSVGAPVGMLLCMSAHRTDEPGSVPAEWEERATLGTVDAEVCKRSGLLLPPRARYVRRAGGSLPPAPARPEPRLSRRALLTRSAALVGRRRDSRARPLLSLAWHARRPSQPQVLYTIHLVLGRVLRDGHRALRR
jgi:hypothetical protein